MQLLRIILPRLELATRKPKYSKKMSVREVGEPGSSGDVGKKILWLVPERKTRSRKSGGLLVSLNRRNELQKEPQNRSISCCSVGCRNKSQTDTHQTLADELQGLDELKATEEEVARLDRAEKGDVAATTIQSRGLSSSCRSGRKN